MKYAIQVIFCWVISLSLPVYAGTWGVGSFENDMASDWAYSLEKTNNPKLLLSTLNAVLLKGYIYSYFCSEAIAAADVVASLRDDKVENLPDEIVRWVKKNKKSYQPEMSKLALKAISQCKDTKRSELAQLWDEPESKEWLNQLSELEARLK